MAEDSSCDAFEPIKTDVLVMESTFGLPYFVGDELEVSKKFSFVGELQTNKKKLSFILLFPRKSQRILHGMKRYFEHLPFPGSIKVHPSISAINNIYKHHGIDFPIILLFPT